MIDYPTDGGLELKECILRAGFGVTILHLKDDLQTSTTSPRRLRDTLSRRTYESLATQRAQAAGLRNEDDDTRRKGRRDVERYATSVYILLLSVRT